MLISDRLVLLIILDGDKLSVCALCVFSFGFASNCLEFNLFYFFLVFINCYFFGWLNFSGVVKYSQNSVGMVPSIWIWPVIGI